MPLFRIECASCGTESEVLARTGDLVACERCNSKDVKRLLGTFAARSGVGAAAPVESCGAPSCCRMAGGGCQN